MNALNYITWFVFPKSNDLDALTKNLKSSVTATTHKVMKTKFPCLLQNTFQSVLIKNVLYLEDCTCSSHRE